MSDVTEQGAGTDARTRANEVSTQELLAALRSEINELVAGAAGPVAEVSARAGECELRIRWDRAHPPAGYRPETAGNGVETAFGPAAATDPAVATDPAAVLGAADAAEPRRVTSPIVGTFYRAPQPGAAPFVEVGQRIAVGQHLAIVEAMKLMNPVRSEWAGTLREVLVADGQSVEFGELLMLIDDGSG